MFNFMVVYQDIVDYYLISIGLDMVMRYREDIILE